MRPVSFEIETNDSNTVQARFCIAYNGAETMLKPKFVAKYKFCRYVNSRHELHSFDRREK